MSHVPLAPVLASLLESHRVEAVVRDHIVYLPALDRWANLWMEQVGEGAWLVEVAATAGGETTVADRCVALGETLEEARADGLGSFCAGSFHVLLAALWGVLERDQVDHELRVIGKREWDVYMGPCTLRASDGVQSLVLPPALPGRVLQQWESVLVDARVHTARLYLAVIDGAVTVEATIDDQPDAAMAEVVRGADWVLPEAGFASLRWFLAASPRLNGPTHSVERSTCAGSAATTVWITGWDPGLQKVSMTRVLRDRAGLSLTEAKSVTDRVLDGVAVAVPLSDAGSAAALASELRALGAQAVVRDDPV